MQRKCILFFCYLLIRNDCYGYQTRENNPLRSLFQNARKMAKGDFRKLTRNILQYDASDIETLPKVIQDQAYVSKQSSDTHGTKTSTLPMPQLVFQKNLFKSYKILYESSSPKYTISTSPMPRNSIFKRDTGKQVKRSNMVHYDTDAFPKDVEFFDLSVPQTSNFKGDTGKQATRINKMHYDTDAYASVAKSSDLSMPQSSNFERDTGKQVTQSNVIYHDTDAYPVDAKSSYLSMPQNSSFKRDTGKQVTRSDLIHHDEGMYTKNAESIETIELSEHQYNRIGRIKREVAKDSPIYFDLDKDSKAESGIKILEPEPGETQCNYKQCVEICNTIYFAIPIHLAQCYNNNCFCFPKKDLYPPVIKNIMKTHSLFGVQQTYE